MDWFILWLGFLVGNLIGRWVFRGSWSLFFDRVWFQTIAIACVLIAHPWR